MEQHVISLIVLIAVTVNTLSLSLVVHCNLIVEDLCLFKRGKITLSYLHICPSHIRWLNQAIRQILVDGLFGYLYLKRVERQPFFILLSPYLYFKALTLRGIKHLMPIPFRNLHFHAISISLLLAISSSNTCHTCCILVSRQHKVKWCYVARYGNITIVGKYGRQTLSLLV